LTPRTSDSLVVIRDGLALAPRPSVMYPVRPLNAPIPVVDVVVGNVISTGVIVLRENIACSVREYAKVIVSSFIKDIVLGECGKGVSCKALVLRGA
jgi:hypothetical protein